MLPHRETLFGHLQAALNTAQVLALLCMVPTQADSWFLVRDAVPVIHLTSMAKLCCVWIFALTHRPLRQASLVRHSRQD